MYLLGKLLIYIKMSISNSANPRKPVLVINPHGIRFAITRVHATQTSSTNTGTNESEPLATLATNLDFHGSQSASGLGKRFFGA
jgi:hypothetical protein